MRTLSAGALAVLAALLLAAPASSALKPADVGVIIAENFDRPAQDRKIGEIEAGAASDLGAGWGSIYVSWNALQPERPTVGGPPSLAGNVVAQYADRFASLKERGLKVNVTFIHTPRWASGSTDATERGLLYEPAGPEPFGNFVAAFAEKFADQVDGYEMFNEPDGGIFWLPKPNPARYAAVARVGTEMVKQYDKAGDNKVFVGATVGANDEFMQEVLETHGLKNAAFDAVAFHSGTGCKTDSPDKGDIREETGSADLHNNLTTAYREMVFMMRSIGIANPVVADTAAGWATMPEANSCNIEGPNLHKKPGGVTHALQAQYLKDYLGCAQQDPELQYLFIFSLYDMADQTKWDQRMGLRNVDQTPKQSFNQLASVLKSGTIPPFGGGFCGGYVDHEAPEVQITTTSPVVGGVPVFSGPLQLTAKATDEHPVQAVRIEIDGKDVPGTTKDGVLHFDALQRAKDLSLGEHTITARAEDEAGNFGNATALKVKKVKPSQMPRTATTLTAKVTRIRGRKVKIKGKLSWPAGLVKPSGRVRIHFKKGKFVSRYGVTPSKPFHKTFTLRKPGRWKVSIWYDAEAPFKTSRVKTFTVRVR